MSSSQNERSTSGLIQAEFVAPATAVVTTTLAFVQETRTAPSVAIWSALVVPISLLALVQSVQNALRTQHQKLTTFEIVMLH
jgi:hypothetical protein